MVHLSWPLCAHMSGGGCLPGGVAAGLLHLLGAREIPENRARLPLRLPCARRLQGARSLPALLSAREAPAPFSQSPLPGFRPLLGSSPPPVSLRSHLCSQPGIISFAKTPRGLFVRSEKVSFSKKRRREVVFPFALRRVTFRHVAERSVAWSSSRSSGADVAKELTVKTNNMLAAMPVANATAPSEAAPRKATPSEATKVRAIATLEVFLGGASYGFMATTYKLSYAAGFTSNQVVAGQGAVRPHPVRNSLRGVDGCAENAGSASVPARRFRLVGLGCFTCCTSILYCYAMSVLPVSVALTLLFQFTWIGTVLQIILTRKPPAISQVIAAAVVVFGTVFASGVYKTGIAGYDPLGLACGFGAPSAAHAS